MTPSSVVTKVFVLLIGLAYPSYCSYKAIHYQDPKQYAQWLIYWIVFSLFLSLERFFDHFVLWIPFYYEMKIIVILWLVSPATKGSTLFYTKFLHPFLIRREQEIDSLIVALNSLGYSTVKKLFRYFFSIIMAFGGQIHYGMLEVIKSRYNLREVKEESDKKESSHSKNNQRNIASRERDIPPPEKDLKELQSPPPTTTNQSTSASIPSVTTRLTRSTLSSSQKTRAPQSTSPRGRSSIPSKGKSLSPEPGSYFDRYLRPRKKVPPVDKS